MRASEAEIVGAHPLADRFPMLPDDELALLAEDIRENGLRHPVVVSQDGLILDGRNRYAACQQIGVEPEVVVADFDDVAAFVLSANVSRRHQSTGSRAMSTALVLADVGRRENGRWKRGSVQAGNGQESTTDWIKALSRAGTVLDHAADLAADVVHGRIDLSVAARQAEERRDAERQKLEREERLAAEEADARAFIEENAPDLAQRVDGEDLESFVEARDLWNRRNREEAERLRREKADAERKAREHKQAMTELYSGIARGLQIVGGYGGYDDVSELMGEFSREHLNPPQYEREFAVSNLRSGINFLTRLIDWQESRNV